MTFQRSLNKHLIGGTFRGFSQQVYKQLHHITEISVARVLQGYLPFIKEQNIPKKYSENVVDYFPLSKNGMTESVSTEKLYHSIVVQSKPATEKFVVHSKPAIEKLVVQSKPAIEKLVVQSKPAIEKTKVSVNKNQRY